MRRGVWLAIGGVALLGIGVWIVIAKLPSFLTGQGTDSTKASPATATPGESRKIQATLFYVSEDGADLVPVSRDVPYGQTAAEQARHIVEAQVAAAPAGMVSAIPPATKVRA